MPVSVRFSLETEKRLAALAARTGRSKAFLVRQMVDNGIEDIEDYYLAADAMERLKNGQDEIISSEKFWASLESP